MTNSNEAEVLFRLFELGLGHEVSIFGSLYVRTLEDGRFSVGFEDNGEILSGEEFFDSSVLAIDRFIELRHHFKLGLDHERETA